MDIEDSSEEVTIEQTLPGDVQPSQKAAPVILITGTPGTGKTTHAQLVAEQSPVPLRHISVGDLVKEKNLYEEYDDEWQSYIVDEDKVPLRMLHDRTWLLIESAARRA